jgi:guanylate kinase
VRENKVLKKPGILLVISGPSGAGKGTLAKALISRHNSIELSISATTRDIRPGEKAEETYYYINKEEFLEKVTQGLFLEYATVYDNYYGTPRDKVLEALDKEVDVILEIDIQGAMQVKKNYAEAVFVFVVPPSLEILKERIICRDREPLEEIEKRLQEVKNELSYIGEYDYVVVNDEIQDAVEHLECIIEAEKCRSTRRLISFE